MLPFLKLKQDASSSSPIETVERKPDEDKEYDALESACEDLGNALEAKDWAAAAAAWRAGNELIQGASE